jgi:hypothetical protein
VALRVDGSTGAPSAVSSLNKETSHPKLLGNKAGMNRHREGRRAHERAEAKRRELRKQRAVLFPDSR